MRLHVYAFIFLCWFLISGSAVAPVDKVAWPQGVEHDFGDIPRQQPVRWAFRFKNVGSEPLVIETVRTTCGCTAVDWSEEPVAPGESGEIAVEYDAYNSGSFNKKIKVFFIQQRKPETLRIFGSVD